MANKTKKPEVLEENKGVDENKNEEKILGQNSGETPAEIIKECLLDEHFEVRKVTVRAVTSVTEGRENGDLITLFLDKKLPVMVADKNSDDDSFIESKSETITSQISSLLAVVKQDDFFAPQFLEYKENPKTLAPVIAGCKIKVLTLRLPHNTKFVNPFSTAGTIREYDEDRILHFIAGIEEVPEEVKKRVEKERMVKSLLSSAKIDLMSVLNSL